MSYDVAGNALNPAEPLLPAPAIMEAKASPVPATRWPAASIPDVWLELKLNVTGATLPPKSWVRTPIYPNESDWFRSDLLKSRLTVPTLLALVITPLPLIGPNGT